VDDVASDSWEGFTVNGGRDLGGGGGGGKDPGAPIGNGKGRDIEIDIGAAIGS
jgi:hypothetical protein